MWIHVAVLKHTKTGHIHAHTEVADSANIDAYKTYTEKICEIGGYELLSLQTHGIPNHVMKKVGYVPA